MITIRRHSHRKLSEVDRYDLLRPVLQWWTGAGAPPPVSALSPFVLPKAVLPRTAVVDVEPAPRRYRFRLVGSANYEDFGADITGRYVDEVFNPDALDVVLAGMDMPTDTATPHFANRRYLTKRGTELCCHRLLLPLVDPSGRVARLLSVSEICSADRNYTDVYRQARRSVTAPASAPMM